MKLLFCTGCQDVFKLTKESKQCICGKSSGHYKDNGLDAVITGPTIPIGFDNGSLLYALRNQPKKGLGRRFVAFVIPEHCETIEHKS